MFEQTIEKDSIVAASRDETRSVCADITSFEPPKNVKIIVDSCGDFSPEVVKTLGVNLIKFPYIINGTEYLDDLFQTTSAREFYDLMRHGTYPTTSAVTPGCYYEIFAEAAREGKPTIYLGLPSSLSSSIESAKVAQKMIKKDYPDFELYVIDNKCPSASAQLLAIETVHQANLGMQAHELVAWVKEARYFTHGYFTIDSFDALAKSGRMPSEAASIGSKLDIKPIFSYDTNGALFLKKLCHGKKKALRAIIDEYKAHTTKERLMPIGILTADAEKEGDYLETLLRREPEYESVPVIRSSVSPIFGSHIGPAMVAMVFWGTDRRKKKTLASHISAFMRDR